jgi:hypothetical protein
VAGEVHSAVKDAYDDQVLAFEAIEDRVGFSREFDIAAPDFVAGPTTWNTCNLAGQGIADQADITLRLRRSPAIFGEGPYPVEVAERLWRQSNLQPLRSAPARFPAI